MAVWGLAIWYNTDMLLLLTAVILMMATTGTCLAQTGLAGNLPPLVTSADIYSTNYINKAVRFEGRVLDVFRAREGLSPSVPPHR